MEDIVIYNIYSIIPRLNPPVISKTSKFLVVQTPYDDDLNSQQHAGTARLCSNCIAVNMSLPEFLHYALYIGSFYYSYFDCVSRSLVLVVGARFAQ